MDENNGIVDPSNKLIWTEYSAMVAIPSVLA
jgi:hypothetical protein